MAYLLRITDGQHSTEIVGQVLKSVYDTYGPWEVQACPEDYPVNTGDPAFDAMNAPLYKATLMSLVAGPEMAYPYALKLSPHHGSETTFLIYVEKESNEEPAQKD